MVRDGLALTPWRFQAPDRTRGRCARFEKAWSVPVDHARLLQRQDAPRVTWLGHVNRSAASGRTRCVDGSEPFSDFAGPMGQVCARAAECVLPSALSNCRPSIWCLFRTTITASLCDATITRLLASGQTPSFLVPEGSEAWFDRRGLASVTELDWWQSVDMPHKVKLHFTPSQRRSRRTPSDTNASLWGGYCLEWSRPGAQPWRFLFPGDTGYGEDFKTIRQRIGAMDFVALPMALALRTRLHETHACEPDRCRTDAVDRSGTRRWPSWGAFGAPSCSLEGLRPTTTRSGRCAASARAGAGPRAVVCGMAKPAPYRCLPERRYTARGLTLEAANFALARAVSVSVARAKATPMRRLVKLSGLPNRRRSVLGTRQRLVPHHQTLCPGLPRRRRSRRWHPACARRCATGRPRMARACSSNSLWCCVHKVTRPVSCGRGLTSLNHTWSPFTNSSTPNKTLRHRGCRSRSWTTVTRACQARVGLHAPWAASFPRSRR